MTLSKDLDITWLRKKQTSREFAPIDQKAVATLVGALSDLFIVLGRNRPIALIDLVDSYVETLLREREDGNGTEYKCPC
jgi:hypothetical protein